MRSFQILTIYILLRDGRVFVIFMAIKVDICIIMTFKKIVLHNNFFLHQFYLYVNTSSYFGNQFAYRSEYTYILGRNKAN